MLNLNGHLTVCKIYTVEWCIYQLYLPVSALTQNIQHIELMWWEHPDYLYLMSQYIWIPLQEILLQRHSFSYRSWKIELLSNREIPPFFFTLSLQTKIAPIFFSPYRRNTHMILNRLNHPHTKHLYAMNPEIFTKFARQSKFHYRPL